LAAFLMSLPLGVMVAWYFGFSGRRRPPTVEERADVTTSLDTLRRTPAHLHGRLRDSSE